jgi:hypothetical protein
MTRRIVGVVAWLITMSINALVVWALVSGGLVDSMFASLPAERRVLAQGMIVVTYAALAGIIALTLAYATLGLILASRRGGGRVGAILLAGGAAFAAVPFGFLVGGTLVLHDPLDPVANVLFLIGPASLPLGYSLIFPIVAITFPDGHLPSPKWRWPTGIALGALATATILVVLRPGEILGTASSRNPLGIDALPAWLSILADPLTSVGVVLISVLGIAAVVTRYRRGSGLERQQLRWFVAAVLLAAVPFTISPLPAGGAGWIVVATFGLLLVPTSVWIAVTRYRLYEIDRLISRGVSWAILSGLLVGVYAGAVLVLQGLLGGVTQGETVAVAASTLLAAALFQPLRRRIQSVVDRRFNRAQYDADRTVQALAVRLRDEVDPNDIRVTVLATVGRAVAPSAAHLWLRERPR